MRDTSSLEVSGPHISARSWSLLQAFGCFLLLPLLLWGSAGNVNGRKGVLSAVLPRRLASTTTMPTHANEDRMSPEARCRLDLDLAPHPEQPACGLSPRKTRWLELPGSGGVRVAVLYVNMDKSAMRRAALEASLRAAGAPFRRIPGVALVKDSGSNISVSGVSPASGHHTRLPEDGAEAGGVP